MVTKKDVHELLDIVYYLSSVTEVGQLAPGLKEESGVPALDEVADALFYAVSGIEALSFKDKKIERVKYLAEKWIKKLEKVYSGDEGNKEKPFYLRAEDAKELEKATAKWVDTIIGLFDDEGTSLLKENAISGIFVNDTSIYLDDFAKADLDDGVNTLLHLYPTPAALVMSRAFERMIRNFYKKITGKSPDYAKQDLNAMLKELEESGKVNKSLTAYLHRLRTIRNEVTHPDKRYSQEEAERMLLKIKDVIEEIDKVDVK